MSTIELLVWKVSNSTRLKRNTIKTINLEQSSKVYFLSLLFCCSCSSLSLSHLYNLVLYMNTKIAMIQYHKDLTIY